MSNRATITGRTDDIQITPTAVSGPGDALITNDASTRVYYWQGTGDAPRDVPHWDSGTVDNRLPIPGTPGTTTVFSMNTSGANNRGLIVLTTTKTEDKKK